MPLRDLQQPPRWPFGRARSLFPRPDSCKAHVECGCKHRLRHTQPLANCAHVACPIPARRFYCNVSCRDSQLTPPCRLRFSPIDLDRFSQARDQQLGRLRFRGFTHTPFLVRSFQPRLIQSFAVVGSLPAERSNVEVYTNSMNCRCESSDKYTTQYYRQQGVFDREDVGSGSALLHRIHAARCIFVRTHRSITSSDPAASRSESL